MFKKWLPLGALSLVLGLAVSQTVMINNQVVAGNAVKPTSSNLTSFLTQFVEQLPQFDPETGEQLAYEEQDTPAPPDEYIPSDRDISVPQAYIDPQHPLHTYYKKWEKASATERANNVIYSKLVGHYLESGVGKATASGVAWGDVHLVMFDGAVCDTNNSVGWHDYVSKGMPGYGGEQFNVNTQPWANNKNTTVIHDYALTTNYGGETFKFQFDLSTLNARVNGQKIAVGTPMTSIGTKQPIWFYRPNQRSLTILTPNTEYGLTYPSNYGNVAVKPRLAPHVGGFYDGILGQSFRFDGKVVGNTGKQTAGSTCDNFTVKGRISDYRTSGPFAYNSTRGSRFVKNAKARVHDGFYPIAPEELH
jgi:hypothetical protein